MVQPQTIVLSLNFITSVSSGFPQDKAFSKSHQWLPSSGNCTNSSSTTNTILLIGRRNTFWEFSDVSPSFSFTLRTTPVESGSVSTIVAIGHVFLIESSLSKTTSPTLKFRFWLFHFCLTCNIWKNSFLHRVQNLLAICWTRRHLLLDLISGLKNVSGGGRITSFFIVRSWLGDRSISVLASVNVSTVRGLKIIIASVSVISVLRFSLFKREPCVFSIPSRISWAERIWRSQMPPMCEAPGRFFCHLTQSIPLFSRCCLIYSWFIPSKAFFNHWMPLQN